MVATSVLKFQIFEESTNVMVFEQNVYGRYGKTVLHFFVNVPVEFRNGGHYILITYGSNNEKGAYLYINGLYMGVSGSNPTFDPTNPSAVDCIYSSPMKNTNYHIKGHQANYFSCKLTDSVYDISLFTDGKVEFTLESIFNQ